MGPLGEPLCLHLEIFCIGFPLEVVLFTFQDSVQPFHSIWGIPVIYITSCWIIKKNISDPVQLHRRPLSRPLDLLHCLPGALGTVQSLSQVPKQTLFPWGGRHSSPSWDRGPWKRGPNAVEDEPGALLGLWSSHPPSLGLSLTPL